MEEVRHALHEPLYLHASRLAGSLQQAQALQDATAGGYQWKQVFLPDGTVLRASFDRQSYYAVVEGSMIKYGEYSLSPSAFANLQGSGNRNAWKAVWLRFPGCPGWVRADECRAVQRAVTARLFDPGQAIEKDEPGAKPAHHVGNHEQHYTDTRPSRATEVPFFQLLNGFPHEDEDAAASPDENPPGASPPSAAASPQPAMKPNKRRHKGRKKRHSS